ncbi:hypothetical protein GN244_ATG19554 [Phytophthora infestans]|uniref:Uncharacterized protein n=1 Tax=Phytophthora infestans TaxID=4787 RepID=A0A833SPT8_PHYIN|nr:hypothetical protein GN244_ATG19554 [Phytophthora infestans]
MHEKLAEIASEIERNKNELDKVKVQLDDQTRLVNSLPSSATGAGRTLRLEKSRSMSERLEKGEKLEPS